MMPIGKNFFMIFDYIGYYVIYMVAHRLGLIKRIRNSTVLVIHLHFSRTGYYLRLK